MIYSEAAYFDGVPVAHCAAWEDAKRLKRIASRNRAAMRGRGDRRQRGRIS